MDEMNQSTGSVNVHRLPPLPGSDPESIARNKFHGFYNVGSRDFWKHSEVNLNKVEEKEKCNHYFAQEGPEVRCKRCFMGMLGPNIRALNGKLLINNEEAVL